MSYFSLVAQLNDDISNPSDGAMWIFGMRVDPEVRVGAACLRGPSREPAAFRYFAASEVFYVYNVANPADPLDAKLRVAKTGLTYSL